MNSPLKRAGAVFGILAIVAAAIFGAAVTAPSASVGAEGTPHLMLTLKDGVVDIELLPAIAPLHVQRVVDLATAGAYDNVLFHRVIDGFMAQTGDVKYAKEGGPEFNLQYAGMGSSDMPDVKAEFSSTHYDRGVLGAARSQDPDSFNSQFFITLADAGFLDGQYTVFGKVVSGMEFVDNIAKGEPPASPDKIISAKIEYK